jgi:hypothetical protein
MTTEYVVQLDVSVSGTAGDWADQGHGHEDRDGMERIYEETVEEYPHRQVRLIRRVTTEEVVHRNYL